MKTNNSQGKTKIGVATPDTRAPKTIKEIEKEIERIKQEYKEDFEMTDFPDIETYLEYCEGDDLIKFKELKAKLQTKKEDLEIIEEWVIKKVRFQKHQGKEHYGLIPDIEIMEELKQKLEGKQEDEE